MTKTLRKIIDEIDQVFEFVEIDFTDDSWRKDIPSETGWYLIKTNTPVSILRSVGPPQYKAHIDIPKTIANALILQDLGIVITEAGGEDYVVYNGETENLKARAREHERGHPKTYCLGLSNYKALHKYKWAYYYVTVASCNLTSSEDKALRLAVEQGWRAKHGWPILCKE